MAADKGAREAWRPLRRLSQIEAAMAYAHALLGGNTQATFLLSLSGDIAADAAARAMRVLAGTIELLSCIIVERDDELWFARPADGASGQVTEEILAGPADGLPLLARETCRVLAAGQALWRLHVVRESDGRTTHLLLTMHHSAVDAETVSQLLAALAARLDGRDEPLPATPLTIGADAYAGAAARQQPAAEACPLAFATWAPLAERSTGVLKADFDPDDSARATALARQYGISVNALLAGLFTSAFGEAAGYDRINLFTAVSLRHRLVPDRPIVDPGCFITVPAILCAPKTGVITGAKHFAGAIAERIGTGLPPYKPHRDLRHAAGNAAEATTFAGIGMTNMGFSDRLRRAAGSRFLDYRPAVNRVGGNLGLTLHVTRSPQTIDCTFTYPRPLLPDAIAEATSALMKQRLNAL
jgi:hypothetical protein